LRENFNDINNDLLVRYLLNEASSEEQLQAEQWIAASAINRKYFEDFKLIWEQSSQLASSRKIHENDAWQRFRQRIHPEQKKQAIVRRIGYRFPWMRMAAMVAFVTLVTWLMTALFGNKTITVQSGQTTIASTLPDNSVVTLNKNASLTYPKRFSGEERDVTLRGEAFFNVTPDKKKPFVVHVNDITVKVVGTSFNIKSIHGKTEVIVETGVVQVIHNNKVVELKPKEKLVTGGADTAMQKEEVPDKLYNYYRSKEFVCNNTPLWKLAESLSEAYNKSITIEREELRNLRITTTFSNKPLDSILTVIEKTFDVKAERKNNQIILK
jgi:transmembrane sensor